MNPIIFGNKGNVGFNAVNICLRAQRTKNKILFVECTTLRDNNELAAFFKLFGARYTF